MHSFLLLLALGCSTTSSSVCSTDAEVLVEGTDPLTCADGKTPARYIRTLAGSPLAPGSLAISIGVVKERHAADPVATRAWLTDLRARGRAIETTAGMAGAEKRSSEIWHLIRDEGPIRKTDTKLWNLQDTTLSVLASDDEERLALTEPDIEGWIRFASLGHEVQGTGVITLSIANKADVYEMTRARFEQGDRAEKIALTSLGVVWPEVTKRWKQADYDRQQRLIGRADWPPRMSATSLAFVQATLDADLVTNADAVHRHLGPLHFRDGDGYFTGEP